MKFLLPLLFIFSLSLHADSNFGTSGTQFLLDTFLDFTNDHGDSGDDGDDQSDNNSSLLDKTGIYSSGWSGAGGDGHRLEGDNIWYLESAQNKNPVSYCIKVANDYPITATQASAIVASSFSKWKTFFKQYGLNNRPVNHQRVQLDGVVRKVTLDFNEVTCHDLRQKTGEELIFLFGVENQMTKTFEEVNFGDAYGMAIRQDYNHKTYRNRGFVSIKNFSADIHKIEHMVLHEIGHVLGMQHDSVFVMDEDVAQILEKDFIPQKWLGQIESPWWVFKLQENTSLVITRRNFQKNIANRFACDFGHKSNGKIPVVLRRQLRFKLSECHQVKILVHEFSGARTFDITAVITDQNGKSVRLSGQLSSSVARAMKNKSPGVFSLFRNKNARLGKGHWSRVTYGEDILQFPARGFLVGPRGSKIAARLSMDRGLVLELFPAGANRWWVVK